MFYAVFLWTYEAVCYRVQELWHTPKGSPQFVQIFRSNVPSLSHYRIEYAARFPDNQVSNRFKAANNTNVYIV